ncbi:hypothetical protein [Nostoc linckia]|uniref:hypothetical protein n=1 Tax=Nostoc linckia TaxID=92942 RepID=UPI00117CD9B5|nr:hypothetical protein [Nostoc linckia]
MTNIVTLVTNIVTLMTNIVTLMTNIVTLVTNIVMFLILAIACFAFTLSLTLSQAMLFLL